MEGISDIRIIGLDERRPPKIRKEPYIDLAFKLSHRAPEDWCKDFNALAAKLPGPPRIREKEGLFVETWVKKPEDIAALLSQIKQKIIECTDAYIARIERAAHDNDDANALLAGEQGEQGRLNRIIESLDFSDEK